MEPPLVTIIMPIRNEATFIARSLGAVLTQDCPHQWMEVLIADGMSSDATREVIVQLSSACDVPVKVLDNPAHIVPTGFNLALAQAQGSIIIRVDGHCEIASDYVRRCIDKLAQTGADCVGGPLVTVGEGWVARGIAVAQSSPFGVGGASFRTGREQGSYVDTLAFGAYRREVFTRIGNLDEELVRNQDDEFNFRLTQAGGKIWLDPSIQSVYYSRISLFGLWRQYFQYGLYKVRVIQKRGSVASWRHLVPALFVLGLIGSVLLLLLTGQSFWVKCVAGPYAFASFLASAWASRRDWHLLPLLPVVFLTLHFAYGVGFLWGLWHWRKFYHK